MAQLSPEKIAETNTFLLSRPVYADAHVPQTARNLHRGPVGRNDAQTSECLCVHTWDAIRAPHLLEIALEYTPFAAEYLDVERSVAYSMNAFWTRPGPAATRADIQELHCDQDDDRFLAMFVFLTDVLTDEDGPQELAGPNNILRRIYGPAGTVFLSDTMRPHRGLKPRSRERGIWWFRWGISERPAAYVWDKIEPLEARCLGNRYPTDTATRDLLRLLIR